MFGNINVIYIIIAIWIFSIIFMVFYLVDMAVNKIKRDNFSKKYHIEKLPKGVKIKKASGMKIIVMN